MLFKNKEKKNEVRLHTKNKKGQMISYEVLFAMTIFLILFVITLSDFNVILTETREVQKNETLKTQAVQASVQLSETPGSPGMWEWLADYNRVGLAVTPRVLGQTKINKFNALDNNNVSYQLNLGNEYYLTLVQDKNVMIQKGTNLDSNRMIEIKRIVLVNGDFAMLTIRIYEGAT